ncbi:DeoR family transcriptional regulator [Pokkaliibacter plantistimulans]|uniref:DeoR family transcriptional regulator n=1 Tax=Pokkaliibacter plantistimulans TaxID=1635171 RepID=A0ABX5LYP2_9GAMM|nr:DeoR/GlpR family DNA-binding transcription regulator [Pokkaliibacter plantistimulans]PXF31789.1 DeoR family transcriptional regulator [Pokkaliibacter plantistimulans]
MIPAERQRKIIALLTQKEVISIAELTETLAVSHMTVRRDIQSLESQGRVVSVSGGVQLSRLITSEPSHKTKEGLEHHKKVSIGKAAAALIGPAARVYLDAGTTTLEIARHLCQRPDVMVVTNDFAIAALLTEFAECELYHTGGLVTRDNQSCVGTLTARTLEQFNLDICFLSTASWDSRGVSTPSESKVPVKQAAMRAAQKSILVSDSSKYGQVGTFKVCALSELDAIVSDSDLSLSARLVVQQQGTKLHVVATETSA